MHKRQNIAAIFLVLLGSVACAPKIDNRGYYKDIDWQQSISVGTTSKDEVLARLGSPSTQSSFGGESWYYMAGRKETVAFFKPETIEQHVLKVDFDAAGIVSHVQAFDKSNAKDFALVKRTTPTEGHTLGFVEQTLGNLGRFNKGSETTPAARNRKGRN